MLRRKSKPSFSAQFPTLSKLGVTETTSYAAALEIVAKAQEGKP